MENLHSGMKLGRRPVQHDRRTLHLASYIQANLVPPPAVDWSKKADAAWGMMRWTSSMTSAS